MSSHVFAGRRRLFLDGACLLLFRLKGETLRFLYPSNRFQVTDVNNRGDDVQLHRQATAALVLSRTEVKGVESFSSGAVEGADCFSSQSQLYPTRVSRAAWTACWSPCRSVGYGFRSLSLPEKRNTTCRVSYVGLVEIFHDHETKSKVGETSKRVNLGVCQLLVF